ncbi:hypothetical protein IU12_10010 [Mycobacterium tuberculosis]|nr:hypothetical protein IU12_10010 [Mycobacterium tuberculosis]
MDRKRRTRSWQTARKVLVVFQAREQVRMQLPVCLVGLELRHRTNAQPGPGRIEFVHRGGDLGADAADVFDRLAPGFDCGIA